MATRLLARGAKPDLVDEGGATAPHLATLSGDPDTVRLFVSGGHGDTRDQEGRTPLMWAGDLTAPGHPHPLQLAGRAAGRCWSACRECTSTWSIPRASPPWLWPCPPPWPTGDCCCQGVTAKVQL